MTLIDPLIQYVLLIGVTLLFSILAISRDSITLSLMASFTWFIAALAHLALGEPSSLLTVSLAMFYFGIGLIFTISTVDKTLSYLKDKRGSLEL
jgi:hypothetical protein